MTREDDFECRVNADTVSWQRVAHPHWQKVLRDLIEQHIAETSSRYAQMLLHDWRRMLRALLADRSEGVRELSADAADRAATAALRA